MDNNHAEGEKQGMPPPYPTGETATAPYPTAQPATAPYPVGQPDPSYPQKDVAGGGAYYPPAQPGAYPQQQPGAYRQQQPGAYPQQQPGAYPQQQQAGVTSPQMVIVTQPQPVVYQSGVNPNNVGAIVGSCLVIWCCWGGCIPGIIAFVYASTSTTGEIYSLLCYV